MADKGQQRQLTVRKSQGMGNLDRTVGRPTKYDPAFVELAYKYCLLGAVDKELAEFFGVSEATLNNWKKEHPKFLESLKEGRENADTNVARSLYQRACGYSHKEDQIFQYKGQPVVVPTIKHYPPDTAAAFIWLKNRQRGKWKDKHEIEHSGQVDIEIIMPPAERKLPIPCQLPMPE